MTSPQARFARLMLLTLLAFVPWAAAQTAPVLPAGIERVTTLEGITEYRLANGLRVVLVPDPSKPSITVNITYMVGSRHEGYGETGMAHLLEHMLFKGTTNRPKLNEEFAPRAARRNGTTSFDRTNYFETFPSTADNLRWALEMEADRMVNSRVAREDLDTEMTVVRNEYERGENEARRVLITRTNSIAFDWHNYGHTAIGNRSDIENVGIENLRAFYRKYYQPDNAVLVVAGNFDEAQALGIIATSFGKISKPTRVLPKLWTVEPTQDGERSFVVRRKGGTPMITLAYKIPGALHDDVAPLDFAGTILASGASSRLHRLLVESGKAASVGFTNYHTVDPGLVYFHVELPPDGNVEEVQKLLIDTVEGFARGSPTTPEMARVKSSQARQHEQTLNSTEALALALTASIARGDWRLIFLNRQRMAATEAAAVVAAAQKYFVRDNRTLGAYLPSEEVMRAEIQAAPSAQAVLRDFKGRDVSVATVEAFDTSAENIDRRTTLRVLANGLKVALLPKQTRGNTVYVRLVMHFGDLESLRGRAHMASLTGGMLTRGAAGMSRQQISGRFSRLMISGATFAGGVTAFRTTRENLPEALRFVTRVLKDPAFPEAEFEQLRSQTITTLERLRSDPATIAAQRLNKHFNIHPADDPRYPLTNEELIERLRVLRADDLRAFHRDFYGTSHAEMALVGDFDDKEAMAVVEEGLGSWNARLPYKRLGNTYREVRRTHENIAVPDKANAMFIARLLAPIRADDPDYPALQVANYLFGGASPSSRLHGRIRQREGLSYGVSSNLGNNRIDPVATFSVNASVAPQNIARLQGVFGEELQRMHREGFSEADVAMAKSSLIQAAEQQRSNDEALALAWTDRLYRSKTFVESAANDQRMRAITRDEVNAAVRRYFDPGRMSSVSVGTL